MENQNQNSTSPRKKLKSPLLVGSHNTKTSVTCSNVPESLFDAANAKKHFTKFGRIQKIRLFPKRRMCIIEYDQPLSAERAVLNAGAYDGFMFEVTRTKPRVRRKSKREDDPDWVPDSDVEEELSAMGGAPVYRVTRQKPMDVEIRVNTLNKGLSRVIKQSPMKRKPVTERKTIMPKQQSGIESPVLVAVTQTSMSTVEAALELQLLRSKVSMTPDEQWRTLDARDKILRSWGGAGARVRVGGATIGTCRDMCPEKERLHRQAEHQVMTLETVPDSDGQLDAGRAVKQYSRSSADQEMPMCYELRPAPVLMRTCVYLLKEIADTTRQISLADWFHFMWDRLRGIRKDITQQALCCADSIKLVEMCARFHAHCAARLADLEHTQFDQKLNTDNLTKCLQTLKHMYTDAKPELKPREAEFRGYIALLNLGDANFWWEIKQLPGELQKSEAITFAIKIFNALDNNNYVRFFRLIKEKATYLQACILLRYFNDVRARALARIVKAYAPRGGSRFPVEDLMNALSFESVDNMKSFISHYGLRISKMDDYEPTIILDRNQFIEDSDPYPLSRSIALIESKRWNTVGEVIAGGQLPGEKFECHLIHSSFNKDGTLKETALVAEDQGYNTINDSNKDISILKAELQKHSHGEKNSDVIERFTDSPKDARILSDISPEKIKSDTNKLFSFKPAIRIASNDAINMSKENEFKEETKKVFSFSRPHESVTPNLFSSNIGSKTDSSLFKEINNKNKDLAIPTQSLFNNANNTDANLFKKPEVSKSIFNLSSNVHKTEELNKNIFNVSREQKDQQIKPSIFHSTSIFGKAKDEPDVGSSDIFGKSENIFAKATEEFDAKKSVNIFAKTMSSKGETGNSVIFGNFSSPNALVPSRTIAENVNNENVRSLFASTVASRNELSPSSLFKSAVSQANGPAFNSLPVSNNLFNSANSAQTDVYDFNENNEEAEKQIAIRNYNEEKLRLEELKRQEELKRIEFKRREEERQKEEARKKQEELKRIEEKRRIEEEKKKEALRKKFKEEEERKAELKRKAEEDARKLQERIDKESAELLEELVNEINKETVLENTNKELNKFRSLVSLAVVATEDLLTEITMEICHSELKSEKLWAEKLMKKFFSLWRKQYLRNVKRRNLLDDVPVWLSGATAIETARTLRRVIENDALKNMNAIHKGYKFTGEPRQIPYPEPYNIVELIKTPLLKRMRYIHYPYDKCFFWKVTLVSPGRAKWLLKKIDIEKWLFDVFGDGKTHEISDSLLRVEKQSWNDLMDFAISVSITDSKERFKNSSEATEGANCMLFYATENDTKLLNTIDEILKQKYPYQVIPIAVIVPDTYISTLEPFLSTMVNQGIISAFKIFIIDSVNVFDSLNASTKSALKWMSKKYPINPPLEVDLLKSVCQRYLGNEIWCMLKSERDNRMSTILKDFKKLVQCYNMAVTKLTHVITNEDLFNYPLFPLEFKKYLDETSPYPKPYEFIPSSAKNSGNLSTIKDIMMQLQLPIPASGFNPNNVITMQEQIRKYCNQIGWLAQNSENVVCKVVAVLPNELTDYEVSSEQFNKCLENYDLIDLLNIIVYEKISKLGFHNLYAIYRKSDLENYRNNDWLLFSDVMSSVKHRPYERADELDMFIECKRRKLALDTMECLMLEEKDCTLVEENIKLNEEKITKYNQCEDEVKKLEQQIEEERKRSNNLDNLLRAALSDV